MTAVPFPVSSSPGARAQEGAGRLINCHVVKTEQGAPTPLKWTRSPGLAQLATAAHTGFRGFVEYNGSIVAVLANRVRRSSTRIVIWTGLAITVGSIITSLSRGGILALAAVFVMLLLQPARSFFPLFHLFTAARIPSSMLSTPWFGGFSIKSVCQARAPTAGPKNLRAAVRARKSLEDRRLARAVVNRDWVCLAPGFGANASLPNRRSGQRSRQAGKRKLYCRALA